MFKKSLLSTLVSVLLLSFLSGCGQKEEIVIPHLDYGVINSSPIKSTTEMDNLNYNELYNKIIDNDSFALAIYNGDCTCWDDFRPVLVDYTNNTNIKIFIIHVDYLIGENSFGLIVDKSVMPSIAIFAKGKLHIQKTYFDDRNLFKDFHKLDEFIKENTIAPKQYYIDKKTLDSKIANNDDFTICFTYSNNYYHRIINKDAIHDWNYEIESTIKPLYIFEINKYAEDGDYQFLKDKYGLSELNNPDFGYQKGFVPTFQNRKGSQILDMIVPLNDFQDNGIVHSYFSKERIKNMPFLEGTSLNLDFDKTKLDKVDTEHGWDTNWELMKFDFYKKYHYPILKLLLSTYIN